MLNSTNSAYYARIMPNYAQLIIQTHFPEEMPAGPARDRLDHALGVVPVDVVRLVERMLGSAAAIPVIQVVGAQIGAESQT
jgi:hypothetical protein